VALSKSSGKWTLCFLNLRFQWQRPVVCVQTGEISRAVEEDESSEGAARSRLYFSRGDRSLFVSIFQQL
jgi:hypothetical protein